MKKRAISSLLVVLVAVSLVLPALATDPAESEETLEAVPVELNDVEPDAESDAEPEPTSFILLEGVPQDIEYEIINGITYATVASFASMADPQAEVEEKDGVVTVSSAKVEQVVVDDEGNTEDVVLETLSMTVFASTPYIVANGRYLYAKDSIIELNDRVAVSLRVLAQVFNLKLGYDAAAHKALLSHIQDAGAYIESGDSYYDADELFWLSRIIYSESGNQILEGKIAVGNVVMNRVSSREFPNTLYDVLNQKNQFVSTSVLKKRTPNAESVVAAKLVLEGVEVLPTALFFNAKGLSSYASRNRPYVATIGNHAFYA